MTHGIPFDALRSFETSDGSKGRFVSIESLEESGYCSIQDMPYTIRILLEAALRRCDGHLITEDDVLSCLLYTSPSPRD